MNTHSGEQLVALQKKYVLNTYSPELVFVRGAGVHLWDENGRQYLDFAAGISVSNLGHCHPAVVEAISKQAESLMHISNLYYNPVQPLLAEKLIQHSFDGMAFFANSGAEANEGLIKFARKWGNPKGKHQIIAMEDSFHGRTLATLAATGRKKYRDGFGPDMPGFVHVPFNDIEALRKAIMPQTAAVLLEPVQGEGGIIAADPAYLKAVRALCDERGILLLFDEVQCGMGRTGHLFAWQGYGVEPDAFSLAKALGNGFPIGAFLVRRPFVDVFAPGSHASTFGGNPLACAAACAVLDTMHKERVLANCIKQGHYFKEKLQALATKYPCVKGVRGRGLMLGLVLDRPAAALVSLLRAEGLIALSAGETVLRLLPPLTVNQEEIDHAVSMIGSALAKMPPKTA